MLTVEVDIPPRALALLQQLPDGVFERVHLDVFTKFVELAAGMEVMAKNLAPVRTGFLRDSIIGTAEQIPLEIKVVASAPYAVFVEYGHQAVPPNSFMRATADMFQNSVIGAITTSIEKAIQI